MRQPSTTRIAFAISVILVSLTTVTYAEKIYEIGPDIVPPKVEEHHEPVYPPKEWKAKVEGTVELALIIGTDHQPHDIEVTKSAGPAFDASAVAAVQRWCFAPATRNGKPMAFRSKITVIFRLR